MNEATPRAAISYAHGQSDAEVLDLSDTLRRKGVDCEVDAYEDSPAKGWLQWMEDVMLSRTVLVVCTATYAERLRGDAPPGQGRGAAWEGRYLKQRVYDGQGQNEGVVPIVFCSADTAHIPPFLKDVTYYDLSQPDGFEKLYRRLTRQPAHPRPPLGAIEKLAPRGAPQKDYSSLVLFDAPNEGRVTVELSTLKHDGGQVTIQVRGSAENISRLRRLGERYGQSIAFAYRLDCYLGRLRAVSHAIENGQDMLTIVLNEERPPAAGGITELSYNNVPGDAIALMRARRILLAEPLPEKYHSDRLMDSFVAGSVTRESKIEVRDSNIPGFAQQIADAGEFAAIARLDSVLQLTLSGTVERIEHLEFQREGQKVHVDFVGYRGRVYTNREPARLEVHEDVII